MTDWTNNLELWYPGTTYPEVGCVKCYRCHVIFVAGIEHHCGLVFGDPEPIAAQQEKEDE